MPPVETQEHLLLNGDTVAISRNGLHQYWTDGQTYRKMASVTSMLGPLDSGFSVGLGWGLKMAREHSKDGIPDLDAPRRVGKEAQEEGTKLHDAIQNYIEQGIVDEESPAFVSWLNALGDYGWKASERFLYHPGANGMGRLFGGTLDAISNSNEIWDWKSVAPGSTFRNTQKNSAQLGAYAMALRAMGSVYAPEKGFLAYIFRDGSGVDIQEVDLKEGWELFKASFHVYQLMKGKGEGNVS